MHTWQVVVGGCISSLSSVRNHVAAVKFGASLTLFIVETDPKQGQSEQGVILRKCASDLSVGPNLSALQMVSPTEAIGETCVQFLKCIFQGWKEF